MRPLLYGVSAFDPWTFITMALGLVAVTALACLIPARQHWQLSLVRLLGRTREIAVRRAIGARSMDVVRLFAVENALSGMLGGALGFLTAVIVLRLVRAAAPPQVPRLDALGSEVAPPRPQQASPFSPCWCSVSCPASWRRASARTPCCAPIRGRARKAGRHGARGSGWSRRRSPWPW